VGKGLGKGGVSVGEGWNEAKGYDAPCLGGGRGGRQE